MTLAGLLTLLLLSCSTSGAGRASEWEARVAWAAALRAEDLADAGDEEGARKLALEARDEARRVGYTPAEVRALAVLGRLDRSALQLRQAAALADSLDDPALKQDIAVLLAETLAWQGRHEKAVGVLDGVLSVSERDPNRVERSRLQARAHHMRAGSLRVLGLDVEARSSERRADVLLTLVPDEQEMSLRLAVKLARGDDDAVLRRWRQAFDAHSKAAMLAQDLGDVSAHARALLGMARATAGMGRLNDAASHCERALERAQSAGDVELARSIAREGLGLLHDLGEPADSERFAVFREALVEG